MDLRGLKIHQQFSRCHCLVGIPPELFVPPSVLFPGDGEERETVVPVSLSGRPVSMATDSSGVKEGKDFLAKFDAVPCDGGEGYGETDKQMLSGGEEH